MVITALPMKDCYKIDKHVIIFNRYKILILLLPAMILQIFAH